jgi:hypothetical protein
MKVEIRRELAPTITQLGRAAGQPLDFSFTPSFPFDVDENHKGWIALSRAIVWEIEASVSAQAWPRAVDMMNLAATFGLDLTQGDASDASIGISLVNQARQALAPHLGKIPPEQLQRLASGLTRAMSRNESADSLIRNEEANMVMAVQWVMDRHKSREFGEIREKLGREVREAVDYLESMEASRKEERPGYFRGFRDEALEMAAYSRNQMAVPLSAWKEWEPAKGAIRPWRRLATHFFTPLYPVLKSRQDSITRLRLVVISSLSLASIQRKGVAPATLPGTDGIKIDPYSGQDFIYRAVGTEFTVYSVGRDGRDDGGETNENFSEPDITIERR